jgi:RimJ/RimL family protein N-acetyltransferase
LFDGDGAARVAATLASDARAADGRRVASRRVKPSDEATMLDWQSDPQTRRFARNPRVPDADEHRKWVARRVADPVAVTEILLHREEPAGVLRLDPHADGLEVSIVVAPDHRRKGIGAAALKLARCLRPQSRLVAHVFSENTASQILFAKAGYVPHAGEYLSQAPLKPAGLAA